MALWANFKKTLSHDDLTENCLADGLLLAGSHFIDSELNATRLDFTSMNEEEIEKAGEIFRESTIRFLLEGRNTAPHEV